MIKAEVMNFIDCTSLSLSYISYTTTEVKNVDK